MANCKYCGESAGFLRKQHKECAERHDRAMASIKAQCSDPMRGFGSFESAARFCSAFDERRHYVRVRQRRGEQVPLAEQRRLFVPRWRSLMAEMQAA